MKKFIALLFISIFLISSCATVYHVQNRKYDSIEDPFTTSSVVFFMDMLFNYSVERTISDSFSYYSIEIRYNGSNWLFIDGDITIQADSKVIKIKDEEPHRMVLSGGNVQETISAIIDESDLQSIANSSNLRIQFYGNPVTISSKGISYIKRFYEENQ